MILSFRCSISLVLSLGLLHHVSEAFTPLTVDEFRSKLPKELVSEFDSLFPESASSFLATPKQQQPTTKKEREWVKDPHWFPGKEEPLEGSAAVSFDYLREFMHDTFLSYGLDEAKATQAADVLMEADKRGIYSHGIGRLKPIYCDRMDDGILFVNNEYEVEKDDQATAVVNGHLSLGLVTGPACMQMAIDKAKKYGIGCVVAKNSTHYGIAGYYATMATNQGCVGFTTTNARPSIAPTFGTSGMMGTNPLTFGIPTDEEHDFVIDCATSVNQRGKIEKYAREGKPTPSGQVIDLDGQIRTDTDQILQDLVTGKAALTPMGGAGDEMGGYKGYGWAATVELLCTAFQSGPFGEALCGINRKTGEKMPMPLGHLFLAINVEALAPSLDEFQQHAGSFLRSLRDSSKDPTGPKRIWTAGQPEYEHYQQRMADGGGTIMIPPALQRDMQKLRDGAKFSKQLKEKYSNFEWET